MPRLLLSVVVLISVFVACTKATDQTATPTPTATTVPAVTPTAAPSPTPPVQAYRNEKYGYEVSLPEGYRVASFFLGQFAEVISNPRVQATPEDNVVLTSFTEEEERVAVQEALETTALGLAPWFGFASGQSVHIFPMEVIYPGISVDDFLRDVNMAGVIRENSEITQVTLESGESATRLTRREVDDNGDFTYDVVIVETSSASAAFVIRIVKTADYDQEAFETIFRSFSLG